MGGSFSVIGVFLTLKYYREKDELIKDKDYTKKKEERDFIENSRNLNVKPYLRILTYLQRDISFCQQIKLNFNNSTFTDVSYDK